MRPGVRSGGESSTATLSPGRIRMKFLRIFPETCASTWCLLSSSTLNMALGNGSRTVAMTSIASSLLMYPFRMLLRQNHGPVFGDRDTVFEIRAVTAVGRNRRPLVFQNSRTRAAGVHHRLNREDHALPQPGALTLRSKIRNLRLFMQPR